MLDPHVSGPIDIHTHAFADEVAAVAIPKLAEASGFRPAYDGTLAGLRRSMAVAGVAHAVIQPVATKPGQVEVINRWCLEVEALPGLSAFGALHPDMSPAAIRNQVAFLKAHGIRGVKIHPEYQDFYPDEDRLEPVYQSLQEAGLVLMLHAGADAAYPPPVRATPRRIRQILDGFPGLRVIAAHMGGFRLWGEVERELVGRRIGLDTAYCAGECPLPWFVEAARAHGGDQVFLASDGPWGDQAGHLAYVRSAGFSPAELERIEFKNALEILRS